MKEKLTPALDQPCMEALQLAGRIIIENGGETYRAEETIAHMGMALGLTEVESFAVPSGLFISYRRPDGVLETSVKRVHRQETNLTRVDWVNRISRMLSAGELDLMQALSRLRGIQRLPGPVSSVWRLPAALVCAGGFSLLFGGGWKEVLCSGLIAALVQLAGNLFSRFRMHWYAASIAGGFLTELLPHLAVLLVPEISMAATVAGALMPLVPGLAMTNAVQDTLRGDMVSGMSHGTQALLTACCIAGGALLSAALLGFLQRRMIL